MIDKIIDLIKWLFTSIFKMDAVNKIIVLTFLLAVGYGVMHYYMFIKKEEIEVKQVETKS